MGSGISVGKTKSESNAVQQTEVKCSDCKQRVYLSQWDTVPEYRPPARNGLFYNGEERADMKEVSEINHTTKKFYYYPRTEGRQSETVYVSTSKFPYTRAKAVAVRQKPNDVKNELSMMQNQECNTQFMRQAQNSSHINPLATGQLWSAPNAVPENSFEDKFVLPHKTVQDLRKSSHTQPYGRHFNFSCDLPTVISTDVAGNGRKRPPTPIPTEWFPAHRTSDYLVASSLLAIENQREQRHCSGTNIHDF